jgi:hypothetical protein
VAARPFSNRLPYSEKPEIRVRVRLEVLANLLRRATKSLSANFEDGLVASSDGRLALDRFFVGLFRLLHTLPIVVRSYPCVLEPHRVAVDPVPAKKSTIRSFFVRECLDQSCEDIDVLGKSNTAAPIRLVRSL